MEATNSPATGAGDAALDSQAVRRVCRGALDRVRRDAALLSELDRVVGDGDHGTTMSRAADRVASRLESIEADTSIAEVLRAIGNVFLDIDGGATGPLIGSMFLGMAGAAGNTDRISSDDLAEIFQGGLRAVRGLTPADVGDKTLMDALVPACRAMDDAARRGESILGQLRSAAIAAEVGAISTRPLRARYGRSKHLGDRVVGHEDPGARSVAILLIGFSDACAQLVSESGGNA